MQSARNKDTSTIITVTFRSLRNQAEVVTHFCGPWRELSGSTISTPFYTDSQGHRTFSFSGTDLHLSPPPLPWLLKRHSVSEALLIFERALAPAVPDVSNLFPGSLRLLPSSLASVTLGPILQVALMP